MQQAMKYNLQGLNVPPLFVTILTYLLSFGVWLLTYFLYDSPEVMISKVGSVAEKILPSSSLSAHLLSYGLVAVNSMLLAQMNNKFSFIRIRTFIPTLIYLLVSACWLSVHGNYIAQIASLFVLLAVFLSLDMYKNKKAVEQAFLSFFFLSIASLLVFDFIFLVAVFWIGYFYLKNMSPRLFISSIFGVITPWLFAAAFIYYFGEVILFTDFQKFISQISLFNQSRIPVIVYSLLMCLILVSSIVQMTARSRHDGLQTRDELNFLKVVGAGVVILAVVRYNSFTAVLPTLAIFYSIFVSYAFTLVKSKFNYFSFIVLNIASFIYVVYLILSPLFLV